MFAAKAISFLYGENFRYKYFNFELSPKQFYKFRLFSVFPETNKYGTGYNKRWTLNKKFECFICIIKWYLALCNTIQTHRQISNTGQKTNTFNAPNVNDFNRMASLLKVPSPEMKETNSIFFILTHFNHRFLFQSQNKSFLFFCQRENFIYFI